MVPRPTARLGRSLSRLLLQHQELAVRLPVGPAVESCFWQLVTGAGYLQAPASLGFSSKAGRAVYAGTPMLFEAKLRTDVELSRLRPALINSITQVLHSNPSFPGGQSSLAT